MNKIESDCMAGEYDHAFGMSKLPLVTIIIVNYNYGRYLKDAVDSVYRQSYPEIECILVDNASTDESPFIIDELISNHTDLIVIRRAANDGQTPASLDGLAASSGQYIIFLDADDYLLPKCIEAHIYVHLSMRPHIAFTSVDMLQVAGKHIVVASGEESNRFIQRKRLPNGKLIRPFQAISGWPSELFAAELNTKIYYVPPLSIKWVWSPTSGQCYRRDALLLFADNDRLRTLRTGTDLYFASGCSGLSGSALIDEPLFAYRIHGGNIFTSRPQLDRTLNFTIGGHGDSNIEAQLFLIDHLVERASRFAPNFPLRLNLLGLIVRLDREDENHELPKWARQSRVAQAIVRHYESFSSVVGHFRARSLLAWCAKSLRSPRSLKKDLPSS